MSEKDNFFQRNLKRWRERRAVKKQQAAEEAAASPESPNAEAVEQTETAATEEVSEKDNFFQRNLKRWRERRSAKKQQATEEAAASPESTNAQALEQPLTPPQTILEAPQQQNITVTRPRTEPVQSLPEHQVTTVFPGLLPTDPQTNIQIIEITVEAEATETIDTESIPVVEVYFEIGSATLNPEEEAKLDQVANILIDFTETRVVITGMADAIGSNARNMQLSKYRADVVGQLLVDKYGIDPLRIKTEAVGDMFSRGLNETDRKVTLKIVEDIDDDTQVEEP